MKTDKALRKALQRNSSELPYGFDQRIMRQIFQEVDRLNRRSYYQALGLVAAVSLCLIAGVYFGLNTFFGINLLNVFASIHLPTLEPHTPVITEATRPILAFSIYIGALVLFLLGMDHWFRKRVGKRG